MAPRGSEKIHAAFQRGGKVEEKDLHWLVDYLKNSEAGAEILTFWIRGQPRPDSVAGTLLVDKARVGEIMQAFTDREPLPLTVSVYTPGIPNQDRVIVGFRGPDIAWQGGQPAVNALEAGRPTSTGSRT